MSKQEARLPDAIDTLLKDMWKVLDGPQVIAHVHGWRYTGPNYDTLLRSAIIAALDEARDEALERAAKAAMGSAPLEAGFRTPYGEGRANAASDIRARKSKRDA